MKMKIYQSHIEYEVIISNLLLALLYNTAHNIVITQLSCVTAMLFASIGSTI